MMIPASIYLLLPCATLRHSSGRQSLLLPPTVPPLPQYDREVVRPPQPNTATDGVRMFCDAGGGLGHWWVLPVVGMAANIYNLCDLRNRGAQYLQKIYL